MSAKAQAGLEYLVTYGWALAIVAVVVGALVFVAGSHSYDLSFSSSDPTAILVRGGTIVNSLAEIVLQNVTGGRIDVTKVGLSGAFSGCKLNGRPFAQGEAIVPPVSVSSGGELHFEDLNYNGGETGTMDIYYTDAVGLDKSVRITVSVKGDKCKYLNCDDGNPCTKDKCRQGVCEYQNWPDGKECGTGNQCVDGNCVGVNQPPIADAGPDQSVSEGQQVTLDANASFDPDGFITLYEWREDGNLLSTASSFAQVYGVGTHTITLKVSDNEDANATDTVNVTVSTPDIFFAQALWADSIPVLHSCVLMNDGSVKCWGNNTYGQLGNGTTTDSSTPVAVSGINNAIAVAGGNFHSCALLNDGTIKCWGAGNNGRLGYGGTSHQYTPVSVSGIDNALAISLGWEHSCALLGDGSIKCWGYNFHGEVGDGTSGDSNVSKLTPVSVVGIDNATAVAAGGNHTCAIVIDEYGNRIYCWGRGSDGQLGNHSFLNQSTPVSISQYEINNTVAISLGANHSCALVSDARVRCWGDNAFGQLGSGTVGVDRYSPIFVPDITNATGVALGDSFSCAILSDCSIKCWGANSFGQLGDGTTTNTLTPVPVSEIDNALDISSGGRHSCAKLPDNSLKCWGQNTYGEVGDGTTTNRYTPVNVVS